MSDAMMNIPARSNVKQLISEKQALERRIDELCAEVERLKEREQNLVTLLRNDCDIEASWDELRRFWYVGLTDEGVRKRDEREAALGRGTCHNLKASWPSLFECDECGYSNDDTYYGSEWHFKFCPNCGCEVARNEQ